MLNVDKLFDFIKVIFSKDGSYEQLTVSDKVKHTFMLNRFCAIKYPIQANLFNVTGMNPLGIAESWRMVTKQYGRVPGWIYIKTKKAKSKTKKEKYKPSDDVILEYMKINEIGQREIDDAMRLNPDELIKHLKILEKHIEGFSK